MRLLTIWCLVALVPFIGCELMGDGYSGDDSDFDAPIDEEDDYDFGDLELSGSGTSPRNETSTVTPTVIVAAASTTQRSIAKEITKGRATTQRGTKDRTTTKIVIEYDDDDDDDDDKAEDDNDNSQSSEAVTVSEKQPVTTSVSSTEGFDIMELIWKQPGIIAGLIGGAILGVLFAILLTLFVIYRLRRRADKTFRKGNSRGSQDEAGAFWFDDEEAGAIAVSRTSAERFPHTQTDAYVSSQGMNDTLKCGQGMSLPAGASAQTQPLLYSSLVTPDAQTAYDEYLANLYNQQLYNGYAQKA